MNIKQANVIRAGMGLAPLATKADKAAQKRKQENNKALRAQNARSYPKIPRLF